MTSVFHRLPAMGGGVCDGTRATRGGEWPRGARRAGGTLCAVLLVAWMAAAVTRSLAAPDATDLMAEASPPQRERGVGAGQARDGRVRRYPLGRVVAETAHPLFCCWFYVVELNV